MHFSKIVFNVSIIINHRKFILYYFLLYNNTNWRFKKDLTSWHFIGNTKNKGATINFVGSHSRIIVYSKRGFCRRENGERNRQSLVQSDNLYFFPSLAIFLYPFLSGDFRRL